MFITKEIQVVKDQVIKIKCDICKKEYDRENDILEIQEFVLIDLIGGYGSVFGDGNKIQLDICQHCLKKYFGDNIRIIE